MTNKIKLDDKIVSLSLDFQHACGIATCLLLAEKKLQHENILEKFEDFASLVNQMKGLQLRLAKLSEATDPNAYKVEIDIVKEVVSTHKHIDHDIWKLVESISVTWGIANQYAQTY